MEGIAEIKRSAAAGGVKERSTVEFPYTDLDNAVEVVNGVHNAGGTACESEQLAAQLSLEAKGGGFRLRVNGAKTFGLLNYERGGRITLTDLGRQIVDSSTERAAKAQAFLSVELYSKVYEEFKGGPLPPQAGLERALASMGVGAGVTDKARQVMLRSAKQAGFFEHAPDRLVKPAIRGDAVTQKDSPSQDQQKQKSSGGNGGGGDLHPLIQGLLVTLPAPGQQWALQDRLNWLTMASTIFNAIYKNEPDEREIRLTLEERTAK